MPFHPAWTWPLVPLAKDAATLRSGDLGRLRLEHGSSAVILDAWRSKPRPYTRTSSKKTASRSVLEQHPRVRVAMIVMDYLAYGWSPDEIRRQHPHPTLAEVHSAVGFYYDHQDEVDSEITTELEEVDRALQKPERSPVWVKLKAQGLIK